MMEHQIKRVASVMMSGVSNSASIPKQSINSKVISINLPQKII